jgi:hypothetical protein
MADKMMESYEKGVVDVGQQGTIQRIPLSSYFEGGEPELTACCTLDGVKVKVRFDYFKDGDIYDVKTTSARVSLDSIQEVSEGLDYDLSAALYSDVCEKLTGNAPAFYFLYMGKRPNNVGAFPVGLYKASDAMIERGRRKYKAALKQLKESRKSGIWYESKIIELA